MCFYILPNGDAMMRESKVNVTFLHAGECNLSKFQRFKQYNALYPPRIEVICGHGADTKKEKPRQTFV